ncbi:hypothetical protein MASR2M48_07330 [Spirochaetota bacterium]
MQGIMWEEFSHGCIDESAIRSSEAYPKAWLHKFGYKLSAGATGTNWIVGVRTGDDEAVKPDFPWAMAETMAERSAHIVSP